MILALGLMIFAILGGLWLVIGLFSVLGGIFGYSMAIFAAISDSIDKNKARRK
jgi:hypothetical protein